MVMVFCVREIVWGFKKINKSESKSKLPLLFLETWSLKPHFSKTLSSESSLWYNMEMVMTIDVDEDPKGTKMDGSDVPRKTQKRKRVSLCSETLKPEEKAAQMEDLRLELDGLFKYYEEMKEKKVFFDVGMCSSSSSTVAVLMEESELPLSKLVEEIHQKLKDGMSAANVKNSVLKVGQRVMYGVPNVEADVLEDQSQTCLWCWEVMGFPFFWNADLMFGFDFD